jgi:hypothetical protein
MIAERHRQVLRIFLKRMANTRMDWAVTGSCGLALNGMDVTVHDIDLQTDKEGAYAIERVLGGTNTRPVTFSSTGGIRSYFGSREIDGILVEIMGDVQKRLPDGTWENAVDIRKHRQYVKMEGLKIPVLSLVYEQEAYELLGRIDKATIIKEWFEKRRV